MNNGAFFYIGQKREKPLNISDEQIIVEAIKLVQEGVSVTFPVNGRSMLPFIIGGKESVVLVKPEKLRKGHVVLAWVDNCRFVVHRIEKIEGDDVFLMGDGNLARGERCKLSDVKALATHVVPADGKPRFLYSGPRLIGSRVWCVFQPVRKWLLFIYRIFHR